MLYARSTQSTAQEREAGLWALLERADDLTTELGGSSEGSTATAESIELPLLDAVKARFATFVSSLKEMAT
jgi:hypothetical protein